MKKRNFLSALLLALCLMSISLSVHAQSQPIESVDETNLDTQLILIVGTKQEVNDTKLPSSLDPVVLQLRATFPFKNYRLAATLINRVKNEGRLELNWIGAPPASPLAAASNV